MPCDEELLRAWRDGDRGAGDVLFERYFRPVFAFFACRVGDDPADLVQRTFLALVESRDRFRGESSVKTFIYSIARHELLGYYRRKNRDQELASRMRCVGEPSRSPSALLGRKGDCLRLARALRRVPLNLQVAIELHYFEDLRGPQLAEALAIPQGTVRSRLRRGLEKLREVLLGMGLARDEWCDEDAIDGWVRGIAPAQIGLESASAVEPIW
jgi:RNA polymerase sigma-70 factor (ECF subfamily)